jgi:phage shock protein A
MFKTILTLVRGATFRAEEEFADKSALLILDQQIRDAAAGIERAKRALAVAIAQDDAEGRRLDATLSRIADLEDRALAALNGGREDLANEAAEAIAVMEADRDSIREARATFAREIASLKAVVRKSGQRLAELERGRRIASAAESVRRLKTGHGFGTPSGTTALADAEATLRRPHRRAVRPGRRLDQGLSRDGRRAAGAVVHHADQDAARCARGRQAREPHRGRPRRAALDGDRARQGMTSCRPGRLSEAKETRDP